MKTTTIAAGLFAGASMLALTSAAYAQAATAKAATAVEEVVVTGSRVIANGNNSPTPVTVVQTKELSQLAPTTINDALAQLPVFQGGRGQFSQPNTTGLFGGGNPATTQLNLRNLASQRTLILFDGQRVAPTNALGVIDVDMVPQQLIQRVDIVTGGVSAVYGSDAIAGVVNYITDKKFVGFKAEGNYGISQRSDDQAWKFGMAMGKNLFDDRAHIEFSYDHYDNEGLLRNQREYYRYSLIGSTPGSTATAGSAANPYGLIKDARGIQTTVGGKITNGALSGQQFSSNGVLTPFVNGQLTGNVNQQIGGDGLVGGQNTLKAPSVFDQFFTRFDADLTDTIHYHGQIAANFKINKSYSGPTGFNTLTFSTSNAFLPAAYKTAMGTATTFNMGKRYDQLGKLTQISNVKNVFVNTGLDGKLGRFSWNIDANFSDNKINDEFQNNVNSQKLAAALDAVVNPANGQIVCNAALTNPAFSSCVPFNAFGPTAASQGAINYVLETTHLVPEFKQTEVGGAISGELFNLPAGPVTGAASAEYRKQTFTQSADALPTMFNPCQATATTPAGTATTPGMRFNCGPTTAAYQVAFANGGGTQTVKEGALEFDAPLLKDVPFFQKLNLNGALRYTSYDVGGKAWTWKVGVAWDVNDDIKIRATRSKDIEAPTLGMVYQPLLVAFINNQDLLTGASPQVPARNTGSPNLVSEIGHTSTAGIVWRPSFIPGFSLSIDAYHIKVDGALIQVQGQSAITQAVCYANPVATNEFCQLQDRPLGNYTNKTAANTVTGWVDIFKNVSKIETYGADFEANYQTQVFSRPTSLRLLTTWQPHYLFDQPGAPEYDFGNVAFPNLVPLQAVPAVQVTGILNVSVTDKLRVGVTERWRSGMKLEPNGVGIFPPGPDAFYVTNLNVSYEFNGTGNEVYLNVRNLFDNLAEPSVGLSASAGYAGTDDPVGRYYTAGFRMRF